jgi:hypothetical protein
MGFGIWVFFALFSPTIAQPSFGAQDDVAREASIPFISGGEDDCLGSTDSLF